MKDRSRLNFNTASNCSRLALVASTFAPAALMLAKMRATCSAVFPFA